MTRRRLAELSGITERRIATIEDMPEPEINADSYEGLAKGLGFNSASDFDIAWRTTPVGRPPRQKKYERPDGKSVQHFGRWLKKLRDALGIADFVFASEGWLAWSVTGLRAAYDSADMALPGGIRDGLVKLLRLADSGELDKLWRADRLPSHIKGIIDERGNPSLSNFMTDGEREESDAAMVATLRDFLAGSRENVQRVLRILRTTAPVHYDLLWEVLQSVPPEPTLADAMDTGQREAAAEAMPEIKKK